MKKGEPLVSQRLLFSVGDWHVVLQVIDDGVGFSVPAHLSTQVERGHLGLMSMREWAAEVGGVLDVESAAWQGTRVCLEMAMLERSQL